MTDDEKVALTKLEIIQSHLRLAADAFGRRHAESFYQGMTYTLKGEAKSVESPLELLFVIWWRAIAEGAWCCSNPYPGASVYLDQQVEVVAGGESFRLDFVIALSADGWQKALDAGFLHWPRIAVEVDGHSFHERTPAQVALRDRRDRLLQQDGWKVFHYSWTEFTTSPHWCVGEVLDFASDHFAETHRRYHTQVPAEYRIDG